MKYRVILQPPAIDDIEQAYLWIKEQAPDAADRWFRGLMQAIDTLESFPHRCGLAEENEHFEQAIPQLLYGRRSGAYRILFTITADRVHVLHVRHSAQQPLKPDRDSGGDAIN